MIDGDMPHMNYILRFEEPLQALQRKPMLRECACIKILLSGGQVLLDAFRNRRTCYRIGLDLCHQRGAQRFRLLQIGKTGTLPWDYISARRATVNPDRAVAVHPEPSFCSRNTTLVNSAVGEVALVESGFWLPATPLQCTSTRTRGKIAPTCFRF